MDFSDHVDDQELDDLMVSNYKKLDCRMHQNSEVLTITQLTKGMSSKNPILQANVLPLLKNSKVLVIDFNPDLSYQETLMIARKMHNTLSQKGMIVLHNKKQYFITDQKIIDDIKKQIPASKEGKLVN